MQKTVYIPVMKMDIGFQVPFQEDTTLEQFKKDTLAEFWKAWKGKSINQHGDVRDLSLSADGVSLKTDEDLHLFLREKRIFRAHVQHFFPRQRSQLS